MPATPRTIHLTDYSGEIAPFVSDIEREAGILMRYASATGASKGSIEADHFLRHMQGHNKLWVVPIPLTHNGHPVWGKVMAQRAVVSSHGLCYRGTLVVVKHEIGHLLGLGHCEGDCCMFSAHPLEVGSGYCPRCLAYLRTRYA